MSKEIKELTQFDVLNAMPDGSINISANNIAGGKTIGKKNDNKAILEVVVDNDTFQEFAYMATHREVKSGCKRRYYMFYSIDADEYDKQYELLKTRIQR